jgi:glycosyltransferase involved in cell wall biosynthesis
MIERLESDGEAVNRLKQNSRSRILERYAWEHITDQYEDLFNDMRSGH